VPQQSSYCASKFAVRGFTESLRVELSPTKVGVTSVHPGGIATNIAASSRVADNAQTRAAHARVVRGFKKMVSPDVAAARIVSGIERNKPRILITRESHVADIAKRILPTDLMTQVMVWGYDRYRARTNTR
jgi:short-subunit dehydrogenase